MTRLVILTGPIAAGKNTVAARLAESLAGRGRTVVVADVDDVAAMEGPPGAAAAGLWFAAHEAHGALVGRWMRSTVDYVVAVGPIYTAEEQAAVTHALPDDAAVLWVVIHAPVSVTLARAQADPGRGISRDPDFHRAAHRRFRELQPQIPAGRTFDSERLDAGQIAAELDAQLRTQELSDPSAPGTRASGAAVPDPARVR
jgi:shikimate kinase